MSLSICPSPLHNKEELPNPKAFVNRFPHLRKFIAEAQPWIETGSDETCLGFIVVVAPGENEITLFIIALFRARLDFTFPNHGDFLFLQEFVSASC